MPSRRSLFALALILACTCPRTPLLAAASDDLVPGDRTLVSSARVSRTEFTYTYRLGLSNVSPRAYRNVTVKVTSTAAATKIVDGDLSFGDVAAKGSKQSSDTFTIRQDRTVAFNPASLLYSITGELVSSPSVSLAASPNPVAAGQNTTLDWSSTNAQSCTAKGGWSGQKPTSGSEVRGPLSADTSFTLECTGPGGSGSATVIVNVTQPEPTVQLSASDASVAAGSSVTLNWSATNAQSCTASGSWSGNKATSGSESVGPLNINATFILTCSGPGGTAQASAGVAVVQPQPTVQLGSSAAAVAGGGNVTLTWSSTNAQSCLASNAWSGAKAASGSEVQGPINSDSTFTLTCSGAGGSAQASTTVTVLPAPTVQLQASAASVTDGESVTLNWTSTNAQACVASGDWAGAKATAGSESVGPLTKNSAFKLSCSGSGGSADKTVEVTVTPAPPPDEIGKIVDYAGPPPPDFSPLEGLPETPEGLPILLDLPGTGVKLAVNPARPRDHVSAYGACLNWIGSCLSPPDRKLDDCVRSAPACKTDTPWTEASTCCPSACYQSYKQQRLGGKSDLAAFRQVLLEDRQCFPGF